MAKYLNSLLYLVILASSVQVPAQNTAETERKGSIEPIFSAGVVNGRAKQLVIPDWPPAARFTNDHGTVRVDVEIDHSGNVSRADAIEGPVLLRLASQEAARKSTFHPILIQGKPVRVSGFIIYNFIPESYNWLEIGFAEPYQLEWTKLPDGFEQAASLKDSFRSASWGENPREEAALMAAIESTLVTSYRELWLFRVGRALNRIRWISRRNDETLSQVGEDLEQLIDTKPEKISESLLRKMNTILMLAQNLESNTFDPIRGTRLNEEMTEFRYMVSAYGR